MSRTLKLAALFLCLCVAVPAVCAQGKCSLRTMAGTYAFYSKGSSSIVDLSVQPIPMHWAATIAPFIIVGKLTFTPDGVGEGFYWLIFGSLNAGLEPIPWQGRIIEMNEDCTGVLEYPDPPETIRERFIVFDNGREFRSVTMQTPNTPTAVWISTLHRISKSVKPVNSCRPQTAHGVYVLRCESIDPTPGSPAFADAALFRLDVSLSGDFTGTLYQKIGPIYLEAPATGTVAVNSDCTFSSTLNTPAFPGTNRERGVFFNEGKEFYMLPIDTVGPGSNDQTPETYAFCQGTRIGQ
ncbi:MAG: hypothetical protein WCC22_12675 [Terriglobales bacterium]